MSRTTVSCLERLLATCLGLPHGQRNGGRSTIDLQKQVLITIWMIGNSECVRLVADRLNITNRFYFVFIAEFVDRLPSCLILIPLGKMINFGSFAQRNALDQWSNDPSLDHADQWSNESFSRVDLIDHWSENGFAQKKRHRSEILIRIVPKECTLSEHHCTN